MGFEQRPETMKPFYELLKLIADSNAKSVIGGVIRLMQSITQALKTK